ncbi:phage minor capsid protein [Nocardia otitidiscaviarum]|uniref:phage minor capsid protein n=1 Tax=Nocardia otitidiscaviarum TaxID=1823 RepID=UPI0004A702BD|nr:phage minor capsid protein [Nocardia otitidiscaviarum]
MPLTPSYGDGHTGAITRLYLTAERALWRLIARTLFGERWTGASWLARILLRLPGFRNRIARIMLGLSTQAAVIVVGIVLAAFRRGADAARDDLTGHADLIDDSAAQRLADQVIEALTVVHRHIPRAAEAIYRETVEQVAHDRRVTDDDSLDQLLREVLARTARRGFTGQVDAHGRRYEFVSYAEMVVRSAVTRAEIDGYCAQLAAAGHDLFVVSDVVGSCPLCRPFEGQVLSISGRTTGTVIEESSTGRLVSATVMASLVQARERGLFHRGCRHTIRVWTPDDPSPPHAVRVPEPVREQRRAANAQQRKARRLHRIRYATNR